MSKVNDEAMRLATAAQLKLHERGWPDLGNDLLVAVDAALRATKPRSATTADEAVQLPLGAKVLDSKGEVWWRARATDGIGETWRGSAGGFTNTADLIKWQGALTVIYTPDATA